MKKEFGKHYLVELIDCQADKLKFVANVKDIFIQAAIKSHASILDHSFYQFQPFGVSGVIHIAESHFSIHTWPEDCYAAFDVFTCGEMDANIAIIELQNGFCAKKIKKQMIVRGYD